MLIMHVVPRGRLSHFIHVYCKILVLGKYCGQLYVLKISNIYNFLMFFV